METSRYKPVPLNKYKDEITSLCDRGTQLCKLPLVLEGSALFCESKIIQIVNATLKDFKFDGLLQNGEYNSSGFQLYYRLSFPCNEWYNFSINSITSQIDGVTDLALPYLLHTNNNNYTESIVSRNQTVKSGIDLFREPFKKKLGWLGRYQLKFVMSSPYWTIALCAVTPLPFYIALYKELRHHSALLTPRYTIYLPNREKLLELGLNTTIAGVIILSLSPSAAILSYSFMIAIQAVGYPCVVLPAILTFFIFLIGRAHRYHVNKLTSEIKSLCEEMVSEMIDNEHRGNKSTNTKPWYKWVELTREMEFLHLSDEELAAYFQNKAIGMYSSLATAAQRETGEIIHKKALRVLEFIKAQ